MEVKKELRIAGKDLRNILLIIIVPLIFTFILEHTTEFQYRGYGGVSLSEYRATSLTLITFLGNEIYEDVSDKNLGYVADDEGILRINGTYQGKLPYYIKAVFADFLLPMALIILSFALYFVRKKYSIKIT